MGESLLPETRSHIHNIRAVCVPLVAHLNVHGQGAHVREVHHDAALAAGVGVLVLISNAHALVQGVAAQALQLVQVACPPVVLAHLAVGQQGRGGWLGGWGGRLRK